MGFFNESVSKTWKCTGKTQAQSHEQQIYSIKTSLLLKPKLPVL